MLLTSLVANLTLADAALFTGAAFYVGFAEQPARLGLGDVALLAEWKPAYKRGTVMQAPLALLGFFLGAWTWWTSASTLFLAGALLMLANWPWTMLVIGPINAKLTGLPDGNAEARALIRRWGSLHAVRTAFGALAVMAFLAGLSGS